MPHDCYTALGQSLTERRRTYRRLFESVLKRPLIDQIRKSINAYHVQGNDKFTDQIERMLARRARPARMGRPKKKP